MKKRLISLVLAVCLLMSFVPTAAIAAIVSNEDAVAMYRLYNPNSGEHFYTGSEEERDNLVNVGWNYEGIGWYAPIKGGEPIHRFFNPNTGDHHYTASMVEMANLRAAGWQYEGVAWNSKGDFPQYRLFNPNAISGMHHYTGSTEERDYLVSLGWNYEGISWYGIDPMKHVEDSTDPSATEITVTFYDGDVVIDTLKTEKNTALGAVPAVEKSSKENAILLGYYLDKNFTEPFYADVPLTKDTKVYAKYEAMASMEELSFTSFAQMDQAPNLSFNIQKVSGTTAAENAATLIVKDGSDPVELSITGSGNNYTVSPVGGYKPGASYQLELAEGWVFADKAETIRAASFSIAMEEVENLKMSDEIAFIQDTDALKYTVGGATHDVLTSDLLSEAGGSFAYDNAADLQPGDIICIYVGKHPEVRENNADLLDPAIYVKVTSVSGNTVNFSQLSDEDQQGVYDVPENFPITVPAMPTETTGTVNINDLDAEMYLQMMGAEDGTLEAAKANAGVGDFITLYVDKDSIESEASLYFGRVTAYNAETGEITFEKCTKKDIEDSMNLYSEIEIEGSDLVTEEEKVELEAILLEQVRSSGFAEEAAYAVAELIAKTDNFRGSNTIYDYVLKDQNGNELSKENIQLDNLGGKFELTDDIELTAELITEGDQLHFDRGVQLAIGVEAEFEVELESEDKIKIDLEATFAQEVFIDPSVKGSIVKKEILWIPVPIGVSVGATIDVMSFTGLSFEAEIYTVEAEDESTWNKVRSIMGNPAEVLELAGLPDELVAGMNTVGDVMDKIAELEEMADKAKSINEQYQGYLDDAAMLWEQVESAGLTSKEDWAAMCDTLDQTSVTSDLLDMMNMTNETGLSTEYYETIDDLMDRYAEMVEKETDWITLVEQEIFVFEVNVLGLVIGVEANFMVHADMSLAIGSNLQYQIGKRYEFWFKIGLFKPSAGSSTMDLIDEQFAFQFYVMGRLGVRAGIKAKMYVGIGTGKLASVGITAELGPYIKLWGFFVYENTKYRAANTTNWISTERMAGALCMEFGLYFKLGFEAEALALFEYSYDFLDEEIPLVTAGTPRYYYRFDYEVADDEMLIINDVDGDSSNGITMEIPTHMLMLKYMDMKTGFQARELLEPSNFIYTLSNPNFTYDQKTNTVSVNVPDGTRYMECDLNITYKHAKVAFSTYDMTITLPLVWTNLSTAELSEYYTASVRVGNVNDGYSTVWSTKLLKNKEFDLPTQEEIEDIISWSDYKFVAGSGYGDQTTTGLTLIDNVSYDFDLGYKTYALTVNGIQNADGSVTSKTYYAKYGETFDFSDLASTGTTDYTNGVFTKFSELTNSVNLNLNNPINGTFADAIANGLTVNANYVDNSVTATFTFTGLEHEDISMKLRKGDIPSLAQADQIASAAGLMIKETYPAIGKLHASATIQVVCGEIVGPKATISFNEDGGSEVEDFEKVEGSLVGNLPEPTKTGYTFGGWFDGEEEYTAATKVPVGGVELTAKWTPNKYIVNFHVNGGDALDEGKDTKEVVFDTNYGTLPEPVRTGYGFQGWFTAQEGGEEVKAADTVAITEDITLYAQWIALESIPETIFDFGDVEVTTYSRGVTAESQYTFTAEEGATYAENEFTVKYMRQGDTEYVDGLPINAGTYNVTISRPADSKYAKFEYTYDAVLKINKAVREPWTVSVKQVDSSYTWIAMELNNETSTIPGVPSIVDGGIPDLSPDAQIIFNIHIYDDVYKSEPVPYTPGATVGIVRDLPYMPSAGLDSSVTVIDPNYEDWTSNNDGSDAFMMKDKPTDKWTDEGNYDISWYNAEATEFTISTPAQFAGVAYLVNNGTDSFAHDTITLTADIDMSGHEWDPIGVGSIYFEGIFDGGNHTISGVFCEETSRSGVGLFSRIRGFATSKVVGADEAGLPIAECSYSVCRVENIVLDDAYISGKYSVGGIVGYASKYTNNAASIFAQTQWKEMLNGIGGLEALAVIDNCVSYAQVEAGTDGDDNSEAGGIVGRLSSHARVHNCVNYGNITGAQMRVGGIVGYLPDGYIKNCVNFGDVTGHSRLGGIVGTSETSGFTYNCYNLGYVVSTRSNDYIGSICGRNVDDEGIVKYNYYKWGNAYGKDGKFRYALGKSGGSVTDGNKDYIASDFSSTISVMGSAAGDYAGMTLIDALNAYAESNTDHCDQWLAIGPNGYPLPAYSATSSLRA